MSDLKTLKEFGIINSLKRENIRSPLLKVNPDSDLSLLIKIMWGDRDNTVGTISAWECTQTNIMVKKIFTDTTTVNDVDMKLYK